MGNILVQFTKISSKPLENLTELELRTVLDTQLEIKEKFESIKQAYFEIDNDEEFQDVEPLLNKTEEDIKEFQLSDSQKLFYLNASLTGAAKQVQSPNDTYDALFKALTLRYENTKLIVDSHIQSIINYKPLVKENSAELRLLINTL
ncbi:uncharacterized protein TNCV_4811181 [Trichonephila clavipes]|nr:uncharacterized protein TNCV_4811181 [Trichonephila clavipes]